VAVEGGERRSLRYETCEICGGIFLESVSEESDPTAAVSSIVDFYRRFGQTKGSLKGKGI
jgi:hypothetical protein